MTIDKTIGKYMGEEYIIKNPRMKDFIKATEEVRWGPSLKFLIKKLGGAADILYLEYEDDYQGYLDVDILLNNGKVFSYKYYYGSCSGCDQWEDDLDRLSRQGKIEYSYFEDDERGSGPALEYVANEMRKEATIFNNINDYNKWIKKVKGHRKGREILER